MHSNLCFCLWALSVLSLSLSSCPCGGPKIGRLILPTPCHVQFGGPNDRQVFTTLRRCDLFITGASRRADNYYSFAPNLPLFSGRCFYIGSYDLTYTYPNGQVSITEAYILQLCSISLWVLAVLTSNPSRCLYCLIQSSNIYHLPAT